MIKCAKCGKFTTEIISIGNSVFGVKTPYFCKPCQLKWHKVYVDACKKKNLEVLYSAIWKTTFLNWLHNPNSNKEKVVFT